MSQKIQEILLFKLDFLAFYNLNVRKTYLKDIWQNPNFK